MARGKRRKTKTFPQQPREGKFSFYYLFWKKQSRRKLLRNNIQISASLGKISRNFLVLCAAYAFSFFIRRCSRLVRCMQDSLWVVEFSFLSSISLFMLLHTFSPQNFDEFLLTLWKRSQTTLEPSFKIVFIIPFTKQNFSSLTCIENVWRNVFGTFNLIKLILQCKICTRQKKSFLYW